MSSVARKTVVLCDRITRGTACGEPAQTYTVTGPDGAWQIDLCGKHAEGVYGVASKEGRVARPEHTRRSMGTSIRPFDPDR